MIKKGFNLSIIILLLLLILSSLSSTIHSQGGASTSTIASRVRRGATNPATCSPTGQNIFLNTTDDVLYICSATNTWTAVGGATTIGGSGVANRLAVWTGTTTLDDLAAGTTTQVLHGNASGLPSFSAVDLTADVTGVLPPANGGVANVSTADQGYFFGVTINLPTAIGASVLVGSNNQVRVFQHIQPYRAVVGKIALEITTSAGGSTVDVGIYDASGNRLLNTGGLSGASLAVVQASITPVTLSPGVYYLAYTSSDATVQARTITAAATMNALLNVNAVKKVGTAANSATAGVLPTSLGAISSLSHAPPAVIFER